MEQQSPPGLLAFVPGGVGSDGWAHKADGERYHSAPLEARQLIIDHVHHLKADPDGYGSADGPCVWLDQENRRCRFHEHRPQICRDFERGCDGCLAWRDEYL
jgi:Fe-S-cluster containining protein